MENINVQVSDKWTRFTKELVESTDKVDTMYPVTFDAKQGKISLIDIVPKETKKVSINLGSDATNDKFELDAHLVTYEWEEENPVTKATKKRTIKLVNLPNADLSKIFEEAAKFAEIWEAFRKFMIIQIMTRDEVNKLSIPGTGILLADQLTNTDGITKDLDAIIRKVYNVDASALNALIKDYDMVKFSMGVKDKLLSKTNAAFIESLKYLANVTKNQSIVKTTTIEKTGIEPSMVKQQDEVIRPIASVGDNRKAKGLSSIL